MNDAQPKKRITTAIMLALCVWGLLLAIGATGYFTQESLFDARRSIIVAVCSTSFLLVWAFVLRSVDKRRSRIESDGRPATSDVPTSDSSTWSKPGLATVGIGAVGFLIWLAAIFSWPNNAGELAEDAQRSALLLTTILGWLAAVSMVISASVGIVALSNPRKAKGKLLGAFGLVICAASIIGFLIRMTP